MPKRISLAACAAVVIVCLLGMTVWIAAAPVPLPPAATADLADAAAVRLDIAKVPDVGGSTAAALGASDAPVPRVAARSHGGATSVLSTGPLLDTESALRTSLVLPVAGITRGELRDNYGQARGTRSHGAIDIMAPRGTPVVAVAGAKVVKLFTSVRGGLTLYLNLPSSRIIYYYAHLDRYADGIQPGSLVTQGQLLGYVGSTGDASPDAPHLHFAIEELPPSGEWWKGQPMNPYPILMANTRDQ